jgi:hypothetical protein
VDEITIITDRVATVDGDVDPGRSTVLIDAADLGTALGWDLKPSGLCRGDVCVPVRDMDALRVGDRLDLVAVATAVGQPSVVDAAASLMAVALPAELRRGALRDLEAPAWQALHDELADDGFTVIAVAIDQDADDVRPFTGGLTLPVLYDPHHLLTELYAISNVPTVVWIDEEDNIARPNGLAHGSDIFAEFTGVESGPHLDEIRRWARDGEIPVTADEARRAVGDLSDEEVRARLHFRVAAEAHRQGLEDVTKRHVVQASELAPDDFTIWRAGMPLVGEDPFGDVMLAKYDEWKQKGMPYHGLPAVTRAEAGI